MFSFRNALACSLLLAILSPVPALAAGHQKSAYFALTAYSTHYQDLKSGSSGSGSPSLSFEPMRELELNVRMKSIFSLAFVGGQTSDRLRSQYGLGIRIDLPGFFFIGGDLFQDIRRRARKYPVNTSLFSNVLFQTREDDVTGESTKSAGSNLGITMDIFLFNRKVFCSTQAAAHNFNGNTYLSYSVGLGIQL